MSWLFALGGQHIGASLLAQVVMSLPALQEIQIQSLGKEDPLEKGMTEAEMVGWHHRLNGHESEQAPGVGDGQGGLACCSPWGRKELDTTDRVNCHLNFLTPTC